MFVIAFSFGRNPFTYSTDEGRVLLNLRTPGIWRYELQLV